MSLPWRSTGTPHGGFPRHLRTSPIGSAWDGTLFPCVLASLAGSYQIDNIKSLATRFHDTWNMLAESTWFMATRLLATGSMRSRGAAAVTALVMTLRRPGNGRCQGSSGPPGSPASGPPPRRQGHPKTVSSRPPPGPRRDQRAPADLRTSVAEDRFDKPPFKDHRTRRTPNIVCDRLHSSFGYPRTDHPAMACVACGLQRACEHVARKPEGLPVPDQK